MNNNKRTAIKTRFKVLVCRFVSQQQHAKMDANTQIFFSFALSFLVQFSEMNACHEVDDRSTAGAAAAAATDTTATQYYISASSNKRNE